MTSGINSSFSNEDLYKITCKWSKDDLKHKCHNSFQKSCTMDLKFATINFFWLMKVFQHDQIQLAFISSYNIVYALFRYSGYNFMICMCVFLRLVWYRIFYRSRRMYGLYVRVQLSYSESLFMYWKSASVFSKMYIRLLLEEVDWTNTNTIWNKFFIVNLCLDEMKFNVNQKN